MKYIIYSSFGLWNGVNISTCMYFGYRYVWFGIETIPPDRAIAALFGTLVIGVVSLIALAATLDLT